MSQINSRRRDFLPTDRMKRIDDKHCRIDRPKNTATDSKGKLIPYDTVFIINNPRTVRDTKFEDNVSSLNIKDFEKTGGTQKCLNELKDDTEIKTPINEKLVRNISRYVDSRLGGVLYSKVRTNVLKNGLAVLAAQIASDTKFGDDCNFTMDSVHALQAFHNFMFPNETNKDFIKEVISPMLDAMREKFPDYKSSHPESSARIQHLFVQLSSKYQTYFSPDKKISKTLTEEAKSPIEAQSHAPQQPKFSKLVSELALTQCENHTAANNYAAMIKKTSASINNFIQRFTQKFEKYITKRSAAQKTPDLNKKRLNVVKNGLANLVMMIVKSEDFDKNPKLVFPWLSAILDFHNFILPNDANKSFIKNILYPALNETAKYCSSLETDTSAIAQDKQQAFDALVSHYASHLLPDLLVNNKAVEQKDAFQTKAKRHPVIRA